MQQFELKSRRRAAWITLWAAAAVVGTTVVAGAADISWIGAPATPLNFATGSNWLGGAVPDVADTGLINNAGIATFGAGFTRTMVNLKLGTDPGTIGGFVQTGGTLNTTTNMVFGANTTGAGTLNMSGGEINVGTGNVGDFSIGDDGAGTATISGGTINTRFAFLGKSTNGHGHVTQTGGTLNVTRNLVMAELKPANLAAPQTPSDYTMSGGTISVGQEMYIGAHGPVTFNLSGNSSVSVVGVLHVAASSAVSDPPGGIGTLNMSGGSFAITGPNAFFVVGDGGAGTFNFSGGNVTTNFYNIGQNFGAVGVVNHTAGAATANFAWVVGEVSRGANVYDLSGGTVTVIGAGDIVPGNLNLGSSAGAKGTLKVRGTGVASVANNAVLGGGNVSGGTLEVSGGTLAVGANGIGNGQLIAGDNGTGTFILSGGHVSTDFLTFGQNTGALGIGTQTGGNLIVRTNVSVGESSTGANVFVVTGGTLTVGTGLTGGSIFVGANGNGTFRVGGTANVTSVGPITNALAGTGTVIVTGGSLTSGGLINNSLYTQSGGTASVGPVTGVGQIVSTGGSLTAASIRQGTLQISGTGAVAVSADGTSTGLSVVNDLSVSGSGKLNLTNNSLVVDYTAATPFAAVRAAIITGYNGGSWNGNGINSSAAAANPAFALGYGEASVVLGAGGGTFFDQAVDATAVLVRYTRSGDANLDGAVNLDDFTALAASFGGASVWTTGDFNYNGVTNLDDFTALAANFGQSASLPRSSPVPEPMAGAIVGAVALLTRRRR